MSRTPADSHPTPRVIVSAPGTGHRGKPGAPWAYRVLVSAMLFQGLSGIGGGIALVAAPSGSLLGLPTGALDGSPFESYAVPGLILLGVLGVVPTVVAWGLWKRRPWSWHGSVLVGTALVIWISVQIMMIGYESEPPLQAIYGALGVAILGLSLTASVRGHLAPASSSRA